MKKIMKSYVSLAISMLIIAGCSSGNPTTPNKANLTNLTKMPSTTPENEIKKINLSGRVIDSVTRKPIENASVLVYAISNEDIMKNIKSGIKPEMLPGASPSNSPAADSTPDPNNLNPSATVRPDTIVSPSPSGSVSASATVSSQPTIIPTINPVPVEENEEISTKSAKKSVKVAALAVSPSPSTSASPASEDDSEGEISTDSLVSALTNLKLNDLSEFQGKTSNDGKFWISKVPDTSVIITINANNYRSISIFNADTTKAEDIALQPIDDKKDSSSIMGSVVSATNNAVDNAVVSASYVVGESFAVPVATNSSGDFRLDELASGERSFFASVKDETGKIVSMGMLDFDVKKGLKLPAVTKPKPVIEVKPSLKPEITEESPEPEVKSSSSAPREKSPYENEEEVKASATPVPVKKAEVKRDKNVPVIKVKSVTDYINIKGKITSAESTTLKSINVYVAFKKKGLPKEEVFLTDKQVEGSADSFDMSLPKLENGYSYHLEFVAVNKRGTYIYHHEYNLKKDEKAVKVSFLPPVAIGRTDFIDKEGDKLPVFSWPTVEGTSFYRVVLDKVDKDNNITTLWEGVTPFSTAVYPVTTGTSKLNSSSTYYWSVEAIRESANWSAADKIQFSKAGINSWSDLSRSPNMEFKMNQSTKDEDIEEIESKKEEQ